MERCFANGSRWPCAAIKLSSIFWASFIMVGWVCRLTNCGHGCDTAKRRSRAPTRHKTILAGCLIWAMMSFPTMLGRGLILAGRHTRHRHFPFFLGMIYPGSGLGVKADSIQAYRWLLIARDLHKSSQYCNDALASRALVAQGMTKSPSRSGWRLTGRKSSSKGARQSNRRIPNAA